MPNYTTMDWDLVQRCQRIRGTNKEITATFNEGEATGRVVFVKEDFQRSAGNRLWVVALSSA